MLLLFRMRFPSLFLSAISHCTPPPTPDSQHIVERAIGVVKKSTNGVASGIDTYNTVPIGRRLEDVEASSIMTVNCDDNDALVHHHNEGGKGIVREFKYVPKSDRKKKDGGLKSGDTTKGRRSSSRRTR